MTSNKGMGFILVTIFLDAVGIGLLIPVIPELIKELSGIDVVDAALYGGALTALFSVMQFIFSPILGAASDAYGRRRILLLSLAAFGVNYIIMGLATTLIWLFIGQALAGIFGATHSVGSAFVADISQPSERSKRFGLLGAAFGFGFVVGPVISGLISEWGIRFPFYLAAFLCLCNAVYGYLILPETLPVEKRQAFKISQSHPVGAIKQLRAYPSVVRLLFAFFLFQMALQSLTVTWPYFSSFAFEWAPKEVGLSLGLYGIVNIIGQGWLIRWMISRFGDHGTTLYASFSLLFSLVGFAVVNDPFIGLLLIIPNALAFMGQSSYRGLISSRIPPEKQGVGQGAIMGMNSFAAIFSPLIFPWLFNLFSSGSLGVIFPGAPFVLGVGFGLVSLMLLRENIH